MGKIMIVDDSMMIRQQVSRLLREAGFEMVEARDGVEALDKLAAHPTVSLVLCDVNMPVMSGLEFLERLGEATPPCTVPVIMLTTESEPTLIQRARALGAKGWIVKPFTADVLLATARKIAGSA